MADTDGLAKLREPFDPKHVGLLPKPTKKDAAKGRCNVCDGWHGLPAVHLDYVGHGAVTDRLLAVDPTWNWEPLASDERGLPLFDLDAQGNPVGLWIKLTVCGVTRLGFGSVTPGAFDAEKQLIGDALRNAAMRFGVALDLWIKGQAEDDEQIAAADERERPARAEPESPYISAANVEKMREACAAEGVDVADVVAAATDNRTADPAQLYKTEIAAARDALRQLTAGPPAGDGAPAPSQTSTGVVSGPEEGGAEIPAVPPDSGNGKREAVKK